MPNNPPIPELPGISRTDLEMLQFSSIQESPDYREDIGYSPRVFSQVSLPYRDPKNMEVWVRRNGDVTLRVTPHSISLPDGSVERLYPYGIIPRLLIAHLATEATRTNSRTVELGDSLSAFMRNLNMSHTGTNAKRLRDHMDRFFRAHLTFDGNVTTATGEGTRTVFFQFADKLTLWNNFENAGDVKVRAPWENEVELSEQFFRQIVDFPVPLDLNALRALGPSPLRVDLYLWLSHRMSYLEHAQHISWEQLSGQFGSQYSDLRKFKHAFREALDGVRKVYPGLNVGEDDATLILRPSRTPIAKRVTTGKPSKLILAGDRFRQAG